MLFNSWSYLFFLAVTFGLFQVITHWNAKTTSAKSATKWMVFLLLAASLVFYGYWDISYLPILLSSVGANFAIAEWMFRQRLSAVAQKRRTILVFGIAGNLGLLGYFKYRFFFAEQLHLLVGTPSLVGEIVLPLGISFFTFQQIAYLVDIYRAEVEEHSFVNYLLFVSFFPQLIAGPIVHHRELIPQLRSRDKTNRSTINYAVGICIFAMGLAKKLLLADVVAGPTDAVFKAAADPKNGAELFTFIDSWAAALGYTFQLYFDFSGYADMAIGSALLFHIRLPQNFASPYRSRSIVEFWRRWHITLSTFLRDYLYIPLGGNRQGSFHRYRNLMITMLLGGLWHGASWLFVFWGFLHGFYLVVAHLSKKLLPRGLPGIVAYPSTFIAVVVAWVFFRATSFDAAMKILGGMLGLNGVGLPWHLFISHHKEPWHGEFFAALNGLLPFTVEALPSTAIGFFSGPVDQGIPAAVLWILNAFSYQMGFRFAPNLCLFLIPILAMICFFTPNTQSIADRLRELLQPSANTKPKRASLRVGFLGGLSGLLAMLSMLTLRNVSVFLYFEF